MLSLQALSSNTKLGSELIDNDFFWETNTKDTIPQSGCNKCGCKKWELKGGLASYV